MPTTDACHQVEYRRAARSRAKPPGQGPAADTERWFGFTDSGPGTAVERIFLTCRAFLSQSEVAMSWGDTAAALVAGGGVAIGFVGAATSYGTTRRAQY